jgi:3'(2'), 5'-bisphosphate nucleotidase
MGEKVEFTSMGSSLKFCLVAEGNADVYCRDLPTMEWDVAAAHCVLEQAGGYVFALAGPGLGPTLKYNKRSLANPPFVAVGDPSGPWREILDRAGLACGGQEIDEATCTWTLEGLGKRGDPRLP